MECITLESPYGNPTYCATFAHPATPHQGTFLHEPCNFQEQLLARVAHPEISEGLPPSDWVSPDLTEQLANGSGDNDDVLLITGHIMTLPMYGESRMRRTYAMQGQ